MYRLPKSVQENLTFLLSETESQIGSLERYLVDQDASAGRRILDRAGYSYNLKVRIQNSCWTSQKAKGSTTKRIRLQAFESVALISTASTNWHALSLSMWNQSKSENIWMKRRLSRFSS
jgi:hypothetical protein